MIHKSLHFVFYIKQLINNFLKDGCITDIVWVSQAANQMHQNA